MIVPDFQFQLDILFEFHLQEASASVHGAEDAAAVAFGNNDFPKRESGIIKFLQAYLADIGQQVGTATGVDEFLIELFIGYLFLAVPVFFVGKPAIYRVAFLHQHFLHFGWIEVQRVYHIPEIGFLVPVSFLRFQPVGIDAIVAGQHLDTHGDVIRVFEKFFQRVRVVSVIDFFPDFVFVFFKELVHFLFLEIMEMDTFILQL